MSILEINDWQLTLRNPAGVTLRAEPAAASAASGALVFGNLALAASRSHPQQFNNRYLSSLSADPIAGDLGKAKNHADLVYQHLLHLKLETSAQIGLAVPGYLTNEQLGLLLGICQEAGLSVSGFVETALAHTLHLPIQSVHHVLDIEMYRLSLAEIVDEGGQRRVLRTTSLDGLGVANFVDGWMNVIADQFVHKTRFDPLHAGGAEQQLFDSVYSWLGSGELNDRRVRVNQGEAAREMEVSARQLQDKLQQRLGAADLNAVSTLAVSPRVQAIPGLTTALQSSGCVLVKVSEDDIAGNYAALNDLLQGEGVRRISSAVSRSTDQAPPQAADTAVEAATHLLLDHRAAALADPRFVNLIDAGSASCLNGDIQVNGNPAHAGQVIQPGDQITCLGSTFTAIRLE